MTQTKDTTAGTSVDAQETLVRWLRGATVAQLLGTVARMRLTEAIGQGTVELDVLARRYGIPAERMVRLLRALTDLGLCEERHPGGYALTELGDLLRPDRPDTLHHLVRLITDPITQRSWAHLETSLRTGRAGFVEAHGSPIFDYLADRPDLSATYHAAMSLLTERIAAEAAMLVDFGRFPVVADVGGGSGTLLREILARHPSVRGVLFDGPEATPKARRLLHAAGLGERCTINTGNFFDEVPAGADLYLLKWILHDWDDERATLILRRCREAMVTTSARLMVIEQVLPETTAPGVPRDPMLSDLNMLAIYGGKERTLPEFEALLRRGGLSVADVQALPGQHPVCLIQALPV
jgi:O-methyltransferase